MIEKIEELMKYETAGDPISGLLWTRKTREKISEMLAIFCFLNSDSKRSTGNDFVFIML